MKKKKLYRFPESQPELIMVITSTLISQANNGFGNDVEVMLYTSA